MQHGGLGHGIGQTPILGGGTLPARAPAIETINITNTKIIFKRVSIITKLNLQRKIKWIYKL